jgi:hypothetical protein
MKKKFVKISEKGIEFLNEAPPHPKFKSKDRKTEVGITGHWTKDMVIHILGENFSASHILTIDDALGLVALIGYELRERLYVPKKAES